MIFNPSTSGVPESVKSYIFPQFLRKTEGCSFFFFFNDFKSSNARKRVISVKAVKAKNQLTNCFCTALYKFPGLS